MSIDTGISPSLHRKLDTKKITEATYNALKDTMQELKDTSMNEVPVDTGNLKRSHEITINKTDTEMIGLLKNSAHYWIYVNYGTSKMKANPFLDRTLSNVNIPEKFRVNIASYTNTIKE